MKAKDKDPAVEEGEEVQQELTESLETTERNHRWNRLVEQMGNWRTKEFGLFCDALVEQEPELAHMLAARLDRSLEAAETRARRIPPEPRPVEGVVRKGG